MSLLAYRVLHVVAVMFVFASLGAALATSLSGSSDARGRKLAGITHGIALLVLLISGFAMLGKGHFGFPPWAIAKIVIWLLIGGSIAVVRKKRSWAPLLWWILPLLGGIAAWLGIVQP